MIWGFHITDKSARIAIFYRACGVSKKLRATGCESVARVFLKDRTGGSSRPTPYLLSGNKSIQKCLLPAEGISSARFLWYQQATMLKKSACCRGLSKSGVYRQQNEKKTILKPTHR
jgi:hypothetical protein